MISGYDTERIITSSSDVAKRPRYASCLSVVSFVASIVQSSSAVFTSDNGGGMFPFVRPRSFVCLTV